MHQDHFLQYKLIYHQLLLVFRSCKCFIVTIRVIYPLTILSIFPSFSITELLMCSFLNVFSYLPLLIPFVLFDTTAAPAPSARIVAAPSFNAFLLIIFSTFLCFLIYFCRFLLYLAYIFSPNKKTGKACTLSQNRTLYMFCLFLITNY